MRLRHRAAVITAVSGIALTSLGLAGPAMASSVAAPSQTAPAATPVSSPSYAPAYNTPMPSQTAPNQTPVAASPTPTPTTKPGRTFSLQGALSALNAAKGTLTLAGTSGDSNTVTVAPTATVSLDGVIAKADSLAAKLAKLPVGAQVNVSGNTTDGGVSVATRVDATSVLPFASAGSVTAVDPTAPSITVKRLTLDGKGTTDVLPVAAKAMITLDGRTVALSAIPVKAHILVAGTVSGGVYSAKSLTAVSRWSLNLSGTVNAVNAANGTVTVSTGSPAQSLTLNVDPKATVKLNGTKVALSNLPIGATVGLTGTETTVGTSITGIDAKVATTKKN